MSRLILKPKAFSVYRDATRFRVVVAGRRFGKTFLARAELIRAATARPNQTVWYVAPTYRMAKRIMWAKLKEALPAAWIRKVHETDLTIVLVNGSTIALFGAENYDSLRGPGVNFLVLDEFAFIALAAWSEVLRPTLSDTGGSALFMSTPDGFNHFYDFYTRGMDASRATWAAYHFTTLEGGWVPFAEVEAAKEDLDERTFRQEYRASFETSAGLVFYSFSEENVRPAVLKDGVPLHAGVDFNVSPYIPASIFTVEKDIVHFVDEVIIPNGNTPLLIQELKARYGDRIRTIYPDPAGRSRTTSAQVGTTDHQLFRNAGYEVKSRMSTLSVKDGISAVNSKLCSLTGKRTMFVDPKAKKTLAGFRRHKIKEGTSVPEKDEWVHIMDAVRYPTEFLFPIRKDNAWVQ